MKNFTVYTDILSLDEKYKISALRKSDGTYTMCSFQFFNKGEEEFWDNEDYLKDVLIPYLKGFLKDDHKEFEKLENILYNDRVLLLKMFEEAETLKLL